MEAMAEAHLRAGNLQAARAMVAQTLEMRVDDTTLRAFGLTELAEIDRRLGDLPSAARGVTEAMRMVTGRDDFLVTSDTIRAVCPMLVEVGDYRLAALSMAVAARIETDAGLVPWMPDVRAETERRITAALSPPELDAIRTEARSMTHDEVFQQAIAALAPLAGTASGPPARQTAVTTQTDTDLDERH